jgi:hypothetical protein
MLAARVTDVFVDTRRERVQQSFTIAITVKTVHPFRCRHHVASQWMAAVNWSTTGGHTVLPNRPRVVLLYSGCGIHVAFPAPEQLQVKTPVAGDASRRFVVVCRDKVKSCIQPDRFHPI